jgi:hypothetical protein
VIFPTKSIAASMRSRQYWSLTPVDGDTPDTGQAWVEAFEDDVMTRPESELRDGIVREYVDEHQRRTRVTFQCPTMTD